MKGKKNMRLLECKQIIYHFKPSDLEIPNNENMNTLRNFSKSVFAKIFAKFKYFEKHIIYSESPDHML